MKSSRMFQDSDLQACSRPFVQPKLLRSSQNCPKPWV